MKKTKTPELKYISCTKFKVGLEVNGKEQEFAQFDDEESAALLATILGFDYIDDDRVKVYITTSTRELIHSAN